MCAKIQELLNPQKRREKLHKAAKRLEMVPTFLTKVFSWDSEVYFDRAASVLRVIRPNLADIFLMLLRNEWTQRYVR